MHTIINVLLFYFSFLSKASGKFIISLEITLLFCAKDIKLVEIVLCVFFLKIMGKGFK